MNDQNFFFQALVYLTAAVISVPIAKRLGLGSVLGYLLAGIVIGPFVLGFIGGEGEDVMHFAEFGVVMMLFLIGLELRPTLLWKMKRSIFGLGGLQVVITALVIAFIAVLFKQNFNQAFTIGLILALSSTAIVIQSLSEKGLLKSQAGQSSFSVLLFQDIAFIPILALLPLFVSEAGLHNGPGQAGHGAPGHAASELSGGLQVLIILGLMASIILVGRFLARYIFRIIARTRLREIFTATALLLVIAIAVAMEQVGLSPALGAFLAGVVLADNEYRHELESDIEPFKGLLLGLFFIAVGASINFSLLLEKPAAILGFLGLLLAVKFIVLYIMGRSFKLKSGQEMLFAFALAQGGEFAFVLISFSQQNGILSGEVSSLLLIVVALSMAITPLLLLVNDKIIQPYFIKTENQGEDFQIEEKENPVIIAGFGRFGVVIGRFLIAHGFKATILDNNPDNIDVLRKFGFKVYYGDATRPDLLHAAGIEQAKILVLAIDDREKSLKIADFVRREYPHLVILGRAVDMKHAYEYLKRDIHDFNRDTFDSSLELGAKALQYLGFRPYQAARAARTFKHHDTEVLHELYQHYEQDEKQYLNEARRFSKELEELLQTEQNQSIHESDTAWDITSLREEVREMYAGIDKGPKDQDAG